MPVETGEQNIGANTFEVEEMNAIARRNRLKSAQFFRKNKFSIKSNQMPLKNTRNSNQMNAYRPKRVNFHKI